MSEATVVIPNWNGIRWLEGCLSSLRAQTVPVKVIMIDNGSVDGSIAYVREHFPEVGIRAFHRNTGFCMAVNAGIRLCRSPYVILLNNDTVCDSHLVEELLKTIKAHPDCFSVGARMMQMDHPELIDDAGDYYCALGWAFADGKNLPASARNRERKIFSACAGAAIYRREIFDRIGFFDERHFAYLEDVDIGYRARLAGYTNRYAPDAVVFHAGSAASGSAYNEFKTKYVSRNSVYLIRKNMPFWQILLNFPLLATGFLIKTVFFFRKGFGKQYVKGLAEGMRMDVGNGQPENGFRGKHFGRNCLKLQVELWINMIRRVWQR